MFNSYQIDLFSENTPFFHILSTSSSLNISLTIRYIMFMSASEFSETLHFDKHNITKFLKYFEKQYDKYEIIDKKR